MISGRFDRRHLVSLLAVGVSLAAPGVARSQPGAAPAASLPPAASAPPLAAMPAAASTCTQPVASTPGAPASKVRRGTPPPPPPSAEQQRAYDALRHEAEEYEHNAKAFRSTLTQIVRHHYEERRRRLLSALDAELNTEKKSLDAARAQAIQRLEDFIKLYSGPNADPSATPDAMFRLAALYEERAREKSSDLADDIRPAIVYYRRIIEEFPGYEELAAVHYYLGHAYTDAGRIEEGQQAWRALVCNNHFQVKGDVTAEDKITLQPMPQDHPDKFWNDWYNRNPVPLDQARKKPGTKAKPVTRAEKPKRGGEQGDKGDKALGIEDPEQVYSSPYLDCKPLPQKATPGEDPRYLAEIWWQIGNNHFDQIDPNGGPYNLNRAVTAYDLALEYKKEPIFGVSMYKQAWTFYKQQRYRTSVDWFVRLLRHTDEMEKLTGDPGADFRQEAYTYIAGSLTYFDFEGPPADDPYIPRNDVLDTETDPLVAEQKMAIAIERVQDATLVPQDAKWTVEIYKSLAQEFIEITQNRNAIATLELTLRRYPNDRDAPVMQNKVAELYDQLSKLAPEGSAARAEYAGKALDARTRLAAYVGTTPWTDANKDDPEALTQAELLVKNGLKRAAADHTNYARSFVDKAQALNDPSEQRGMLDRAIAEYRLAESGWKAYLEQEPNAMDAYESRFWLADSRYWIVILTLAEDKAPTGDEICLARSSSTEVRDSNEDDKYQTNAGYYIVTIAEKLLEYQYREFEQSSGSRGIEKRDAVKFNGEAENKKVVVDPIPPPVQDTIQARDDYVARIPPERDPHKNGLLYQFQAGEYAFVYGQFAEARKRLTPMYEQYCGVNEWGYKAWDRLFSMAGFEHDIEAVRKLVTGKLCAVTEEDKIVERVKRGDIEKALAYTDAAKLFEEAEHMPDGPERQAKYRLAAAAYKAALDAAPEKKEAAEAAINGAIAYKHVGEYDKAIEMYELFISKYGNEKLLQRLKVGDSKATPPVQPDKAEYETRVKYLKDAYDALAASYVLFFNYPKAADTFDKISTNGNFTQNDRREAARQALQLYASMADHGGMERARVRFRDLGASPKEMAEADFIIAESELKKWDEFSADDGANAAARRKAQAAMEEYYDANKKKDVAAEYVVRAAYWIAKMKKASGSTEVDKWWNNTIDAFQTFERVAPKKDGKSSALGTREAGMAAQAEYTMLDAELVKKFDYESGFHRFKGPSADVVKQYRADAAVAKKYFDRLQHVIDAYVSPEWTVVAISRQGTLYDSLRTGLYNTRPPALKMFTPEQEKALKRAEDSDSPALQEKADAIRVSVTKAWREAKERELDSADAICIDRYGTAVVLARRYSVSSPAVVHAIRRAAFLTEVVGEAKMKSYAGGVKELNYTEGMFLRMRPGQVTAPAPNGMPAPLPAAAQ